MNVWVKIHPVLGAAPVSMRRQLPITLGSIVMMKIWAQAQHHGAAQCPLMAVFILSPTLVSPISSVQLLVGEEALGVQQVLIPPVATMLPGSIAQAQLAPPQPQNPPLDP